MLLLLYRMIEEDSSVTMATQLRIAPERMPLAIMGTVIRTNVFALDAPRLMAASSMLGEICISVAVADRIVYGNRRMTNEITMIANVPVSASGFLPKASSSARPTTAPGMM